MVVAYTAYHNTAHSATPNISTTANTLSEVLDSGAALTTNTTVGTSTGYGEVLARGSGGVLAWAGTGSIGNPTGHGWCDDLTVLENVTFAAGTWTPTFRLFSTIGSLGVDIYYRAFRYSIGQNSYTLINTFAKTGQTLVTAGTTFAFTGVSLGTQAFGSGDRLYTDLWCNITSNTLGNSTTLIKPSASNGSTPASGVVTSQLVTPGFTTNTNLPTIFYFHKPHFRVQ